MVKIQASGPSEAARAIRKKLKYGNVHRQLRALVILDGLIQNAGPHFQRAFADEPLLERLRVCGTSGLSDPAVRRKCTEMFREWSQYASTPGLERVARLHKVSLGRPDQPRVNGKRRLVPGSWIDWSGMQELPKRKVAVTQDMSKVIRETENPFGDDEEEEAAERASRPSAAEPSSKLRHSQTALGPDHPSAKAGEKKHTKDKHKSKRKVNRGAFSLEAEKDKIKSIIAESFIESTNLMNSLQSINSERQRISENRDALEHFEACKQLRRRILRHVNPQPWAPLLHLFGHASHMVRRRPRVTSANTRASRSISSRASSGSAACSTPTTSSCMLSCPLSSWTSPSTPTATLTTSSPTKLTFTEVGPAQQSDLGSLLRLRLLIA